MNELDHTHDPAVTSWVASANVNGAAFPIQNLPFSEFRGAGALGEPFRGGVAIGASVLDLAALARANVLSEIAATAADVCSQPTLNAFLERGPDAWRALRHALFALFRADGVERDPNVVAVVEKALVPLSACEFSLPIDIGNYSDFYTSIHHARSIAKLFTQDGAIPSNFQWMPQAYHGRASSLVVSGCDVRRPRGQVLAPDATEPTFAASARLDYELELGIVIGTGNPLGERVDVASAAERAFGMFLLNDWSARDIQTWESTPLGPFQAKSFATSVSPWIVTMDALAPYRIPWNRPASEPQPLARLDAPSIRERGALDIELTVELETSRMRATNAAPAPLSRTNFKHQYWAIGQMIAHHTDNGCNLIAGDVLGSGTISGPQPSEAGAMIELSFGGRKPVELGNGETRSFLEDGDVVIMTAWCERDGFKRIGFGRNVGRVVPAN